MLVKARRVAAATAVSLALLVGAGQAAQFDEAQRKELGEIIRSYLIENPQVLREAIEALERKQAEAEAATAKNAISTRAAEIFRADGDLVAGNPQGSVTLVEFFDYNCGYCKRSLPDVLKLIEADKDLRVVMKEFPILGPGSTFAAKAALASRKQGKYWEFHQALLGERGGIDEAKVVALAEKIGLDVEKLKADMAAPEVQEVIDRNMAVADALGVQGTPAFIIDQTLVPGAVGAGTLSEAIASVRASGGCKSC